MRYVNAVLKFFSRLVEDEFINRREVDYIAVKDAIRWSDALNDAYDQNLGWVGLGMLTDGQLILCGVSREHVDQLIDDGHDLHMKMRAHQLHILKSRHLQFEGRTNALKSEADELNIELQIAEGLSRAIIRRVDR